MREALEKNSPIAKRKEAGSVSSNQTKRKTKKTGTKPIVTCLLAVFSVWLYGKCIEAELVTWYTYDASIELDSHRHPSMIGSGMQTNISSGYWSIEHVCHHNISVVVATE